MIFTYTDFGIAGPYLGQMQAVLHTWAPQAPVVNLCADAPAFAVRPAAYLLASLVPYLPDDGVILGVVDPGVGSERLPLVLRADNRWFVGPDNGLFAVVAGAARQTAWWRIDWRPAWQSASFHGRDVFAPVAAMLARGEAVPGTAMPGPMTNPAWPADLPEIIYIDHYGNAMTGMRGECLTAAAHLQVNATLIPPARVFAAVPRGQPLCYVNSSGLIEIAVNQGHAGMDLDLQIGTPVTLQAS